MAVFFRAVLYIPHAIVLTAWSFGAAVFVAIAWLALLIEGRLPTARYVIA